MILPLSFPVIREVYRPKNRSGSFGSRFYFFGEKGLIMRLQTSLGLDIALSIVSLALAAGRAEKMLPLTVVVIDVSGKIIAS